MYRSRIVLYGMLFQMYVESKSVRLASLYIMQFVRTHEAFPPSQYIYKNLAMPKSNAHIYLLHSTFPLLP
jgi:hypothetical protein